MLIRYSKPIFTAAAVIAAAAFIFEALAGGCFYRVVINSKTDKGFIQKPQSGVPSIFEQEIDTFTWNIKSSDGLKLYGDVYAQKKESRKWALIAHGYNSRAAFMESFAMSFTAEGFNVLAVDLRGHGRSEGDFFGMGYPDAADILLWLQKIIERDTKAEIVLFGTSMGGAAVLCASSMLLPKNVKGIISDSSYTSAWDEFHHQIKSRFKIPASWLLLPANIVTKIRAGYYITDANPQNSVKLSKTPILFIHGGADDFVPFAMQKKLYDSANCEKYFLAVHSAAHVGSAESEPELYWGAIRGFVGQVMNL